VVANASCVFNKIGGRTSVSGKVNLAGRCAVFQPGFGL
jgi:hypothetical protein